MQFVRRCYGLRGIYGRFDSKIRFEIESDGLFDSRFDSNAKKTIRRSLVETEHWKLHSTGRLASKFASFVYNWKHLEPYGCSCLCQPTATDNDGTQTLSSEILESNFFHHCSKSHRFDAWHTEGSHQKQRRHCSVLIFSLCTVFK